MSTQPQPQLQIQVEQKSVGVAYLLWLFFGTFGAPSFYLGKTGRGVSMLLTLGWLFVGLFVDLFTLPRQVREVNEALLVEARAKQRSTS